MGPLLLLVDDYDDAREMYAEYLRISGFQVIAADSGRAALLAVQNGERPALILMDLKMPGMTGSEVLRQLRVQPHLVGVPIVAFTAYAFHTQMVQAISEGFDDVIPKPCLPDRLVALIQCYLSAQVGHRLFAATGLRGAVGTGSESFLRASLTAHPDCPSPMAIARTPLEARTWLFVRGTESVRVKRTGFQDGTYELMIEGPFAAESRLALPDVVTCVREQIQIEQRLVAQGFSLEALVSDRRSSGIRRVTSRTERRRA